MPDIKYSLVLLLSLLFISGCLTFNDDRGPVLIEDIQVIDLNTIDTNTNEFIELIDTPSAYPDTNRLLAVNEDTNGLYFPPVKLFQNLFDTANQTTDDITEGILVTNQFSKWTNSGALLVPRGGEGWFVLADSFMTGASTLFLGSGFGGAHIESFLLDGVNTFGDVGTQFIWSIAFNDTVYGGRNLFSCGSDNVFTVAQTCVQGVMRAVNRTLGGQQQRSWGDIYIGLDDTSDGNFTMDQNGGFSGVRSTFITEQQFQTRDPAITLAAVFSGGERVVTGSNVDASVLYNYNAEGCINDSDVGKINRCILFNIEKVDTGSGEISEYYVMRIPKSKDGNVNYEITLEKDGAINFRIDDNNQTSISSDENGALNLHAGTDINLSILGNVTVDFNADTTHILQNLLIDGNLDGGSHVKNPSGIRAGAIDKGNYTQIDTNGQIELFGNARVWREVQFRVGDITKPASNSPTSTEIGNFPVLQFASDMNRSIFLSFEVPLDADLNQDFEFHVTWAPTNTNTGDVIWCINVSDLDTNSGELLTDLHTVSCVTDPGNGITDEILESESVELGETLHVGHVVGIKFTRAASTAEDTYNSDASLIKITISYVANRLGAEFDKVIHH